MFLCVWTKIGKYTRYSSSFRAEVAVDRMAYQRRAVEGNIWYLKQLRFRLSVYNVVLGRGTYNLLREDRLTQQAQKTPGNCMLEIPDGICCTPQALYSMVAGV